MKTISSSSEDVYDVEKIRDDRMFRGKKQYLIKWVGYPETDNTWEFESNLFCSEILEAYENDKKNRLKEKLPSKSKAKEPTENQAKKTKVDDSHKESTTPSTTDKKETRKSEPSTKESSENKNIDILRDVQIKNAPLFIRPVTNEWDLKINKVVHVFNKDGELYAEFIDVVGDKGVCSAEEIRYKAPLKLINFYEANLRFSE